MKGYMIFVEGQNPPTVVHVNHKAALEEARRLAKKAADKEVIVFQVCKRYKCTDGEVESIGSHLPGKVHVATADLVRHNSPDRLMSKTERERSTGTLKLAHSKKPRLT